MPTNLSAFANDLMAEAKQLAAAQFGDEQAKRPEVVLPIFQGLTTIKQAEATASLEHLIERAVGALIENR